MLRNRSAASVLQKTYDESYLTCSTAVYYEGQGNEDEAMRCWKQALEQIYDQQTNKILPTFTPRSETERALVESLRQLEIQCKERIDLLEALRLSRLESLKHEASTPSASRLSPLPNPSETPKGWIGDGTIPAATYTDLSRPNPTKRPFVGTRSISEQTMPTPGPSAEPGTPGGEFPFASPRPVLASPLLASRSSLEEITSSRTRSPEKHTMRTTLRTGRLGEKKASHRRTPSTSVSERPGASKAASLAWSYLGKRERSSPSGSASGNGGGAGTTDQAGSAPSASSPYSSERLRQSPALAGRQQQWDTHTRRLVTCRPRSQSKPPDGRPTPESSTPRRSDEHTHRRQSSFTISAAAASSALNSLTLRDHNERSPLEGEEGFRIRTAPLQTPRRRPLPRTGNTDDEDTSYSTKGSATTTRKSNRQISDPMLGQRKPIGRTSYSTSTTRPVPGRSAMIQDVDTPRMSARARGKKLEQPPTSLSSEDSEYETTRRPTARQQHLRRQRLKQREASLVLDTPAHNSESVESEGEDGAAQQKSEATKWNKQKAKILRRLPPGVDEHAAKQILNDIVVHGDEVHWSDIAGLEVAKNALRETVVYPFLRPDLFKGLREPARGMLLFGPPGTGKTMLARAVATESKSTFFSISASSLTSKYLGESEKLVRALFALAKLLSPSIIFVDEIDSLLSQRSGSGEHEATMRIKTEFLIQWSDLQRAAAGRETTAKGIKENGTEGDVNRVLVLAATNLPWAIDEAARRRFVRRQYIPLPEADTRAIQFKTLLSQQKHTLTNEDINELVNLTDGFSGSDITALAKDAAMGPLRSLGEALLQTTMDQIRPIELQDFVTSLATIRPSVSKANLKFYEDWARDFGERGG